MHATHDEYVSDGVMNQVVAAIARSHELRGCLILAACFGLVPPVIGFLLGGPEVALCVGTVGIVMSLVFCVVAIDSKLGTPDIPRLRKRIHGKREVLQFGCTWFVLVADDATMIRVSLPDYTEALPGDYITGLYTEWLC